jgi:hypothetical protein
VLEVLVIVPPVKGRYEVLSNAREPNVFKVHPFAVPLDTITWSLVVPEPVK